MFLTAPLQIYTQIGPRAKHVFGRNSARFHLICLKLIYQKENDFIVQGIFAMT